MVLQHCETVVPTLKLLGDLWRSQELMMEGEQKKTNMTWNFNREKQDQCLCSRHPSVWALRAGFLCSLLLIFSKVPITKRRQINHRWKLIYPHSIKLRSNYFFFPSKSAISPLWKFIPAPGEKQNLWKCMLKAQCFEEKSPQPFSSICSFSSTSSGSTSICLLFDASLRWLPACHFS